jgi:hypothetical protein
MDMQDKEFDRIFSQKFENFEEEPSPMVWDNIAIKVERKKSTRSILPWLSIAATVLIAVTAGIMFLQKGDQAIEQKKPTKLVAKRVEPVASVKDEAKEAEPVITAKPAKAVSRVITSASGRRHNNVASSKSVTIPVDVTPADVFDHEPLINNQPIIATITNPASLKVQATLPDVQLVPKMLNTEIQGEKSVTASVEGQDGKPGKKRGIHSMGGLINAIVAKFDKRDNKLIEFSDGDEDDDNGTTLTGVNLGLIRIKKQ